MLTQFIQFSLIFFFVIFRHVVAFASQTHTQSSVTEKQSSVEKSAHTRKKAIANYKYVSVAVLCVCARVRFFSFIFFSTFGLWIYLVFLFSAQCCYCAICVKLLLFEARRNHMFQQLSRALIQKTAATTARLTSIAYFSLNIWTKKKVMLQNDIVRYTQTVPRNEATAFEKSTCIHTFHVNIEHLCDGNDSLKRKINRVAVRKFIWLCFKAGTAVHRLYRNHYHSNTMNSLSVWRRNHCDFCITHTLGQYAWYTCLEFETMDYNGVFRL